jgi:hypothetical protein
MTTTLAALLDDAHLSDAQYDLADRIEGVLWTKPPEVTWTPSAIARRLGVDTAAVAAVLPWMARHLYVRTYGNGARTRYGRWQGVKLS